MKVLVVDDDPSMRALLTHLLGASGHTIRSAHDGFSALADMRVYRPDVLISDLNMPGMNGYEFLSVVRRRFPEIRVIAMSASYSSDTVPAEVAADLFYPKGQTDVLTMLRLLTSLDGPVRGTTRVGRSPIWISVRANQVACGSQLSVACPECLRTFCIQLRDAASRCTEAQCDHCAASVRYEVVPSLLVDSCPNVLLSLMSA